MDEVEILSLKKALEEEQRARKLAESKLEDLEKVVEQLKVNNTKLQESVVQKESELKGVFENINDAFVLIDLRGNAIKMNDIAINIFGYEIKDNKPFNLMSVVHPEDFEYTQHAFRKLIKDGFYTGYRSRIISKDKSIKFVEVNSSLVYDKDGKIIAAQGIARDITEEIAIQELLEEQKGQLDVILNNSPLGIALSSTEKDLDFIFVNRSLANMFGYSLEEMKKKRMKELTYPEDLEESKTLVKRLLLGQLNRFSIEKRYVKADGSILWAKTIVHAVRGAEGDVKFQIVFIEDITETKFSKEKLVESENRLSSLISHLDSGVLLEDESRNIVITNQKFCDIFSLPFTPDALQGKNHEVLLEDSKFIFERPEYFLHRVRKLVKDKKVVLGDELRLMNGKILERDYIPISQNKEYKGHLWTYRDVTLSRNYRKSLEAHKKRYSNIIANLKLGLVELDNENKILSANKSFIRMTGFDEDKIVDKSLKDLFKKEKIKELLQEGSMERRKNRTGSYEFKFINNLNEEKVLLVSAAPNFDLTGELIGSIGIILDITNIRKLESQKEELLKTLELRNVELEEYAHIVSHDLKSPLRSISALTSWIKEDYGENIGVEGIKNIDLIQEVVEKMERLINDILNYSSIQTNTSSTEEVNTFEVIDGIRKLIYIPKHIKVNINPELPTIKADKVRIQQLFQNLMSNAVNYIDKEEGLLAVDFKEGKNNYTFSVADNGVGIAKEYHAKIFEVFQSLGNHEDSTGIGLSIVKKIVDVYDGKIWLESEEGKGTTFFIKLKKN